MRIASIRVAKLLDTSNMAEFLLATRLVDTVCILHHQVLTNLIKSHVDEANRILFLDRSLIFSRIHTEMVQDHSLDLYTVDIYRQVAHIKLFHFGLTFAGSHSGCQLVTAGLLRNYLQFNIIKSLRKCRKRDWNGLLLARNPFRR